MGFLRWALKCSGCILYVCALLRPIRNGGSQSKHWICRFRFESIHTGMLGKETGDSVGVFLILLVGKTAGHFLGKSAGNTVSNSHAWLWRCHTALLLWRKKKLIMETLCLGSDDAETLLLKAALLQVICLYQKVVPHLVARSSFDFSKLLKGMWWIFLFPPLFSLAVYKVHSRRECLLFCGDKELFSKSSPF